MGKLLFEYDRIVGNDGSLFVERLAMRQEEGGKCIIIKGCQIEILDF